MLFTYLRSEPGKRYVTIADIDKGAAEAITNDNADDDDNNDDHDNTDNASNTNDNDNDTNHNDTDTNDT